MAVGKNEDINTIYNVGKMKKKERGTGSSTVASSINDRIAPSKPDVNTNTKYIIKHFVSDLYQLF